MGPGREPEVCENDELVSEFEIACRGGDYEFADEYKKEILRRLESNIQPAADPNAVLERNGIDPTGWTWHTPAPKEAVTQIKSIRPTTAVLSEEEARAFETTASDPEPTESIGMERVREKFQDFKGGRR